MKDNVKQLQELIQSQGQQKQQPQVENKRIAPKNDNSGDTVADPVLQVIHDEKLLFKTTNIDYYILGKLPQDFSSMQVTLLAAEETSDKRERYKIDLYEYNQVRQAVRAIASLFFINEEIVEADFRVLVNLVEQYRDKHAEEGYKHINPSRHIMQSTQQSAAVEFLCSEYLMPATELLLEKAGIKGQKSIKLLTYLVAASYKSASPLHLGIEGSPGMVKEFIETLSHCLPPEDLLLLNNVSGRSFYHCTHDELKNKVLVLPNGIDKKAMQALAQLRQGDSLTTATTVKDKLSNMVSAVKTVRSHFSSLVYETNKRNDGILTVGLDESPAQAEVLIQYANEKFAGKYDEEKESAYKDVLQNIIRCLNQYEVVNPSAHKINLPVKGKDKIRMNQIFQALVKHICLFHQYQRKKDKQGRLLVEKEDMKIAGEMLFGDNIMENDELHPLLRKFYENIKTYVKEKAIGKLEEYHFGMREIRQELDMSKNYCFRYMEELRELEYVERIGYANKGFKYSISFWDDAFKVKSMMKDNFNKQINKLAA